MNNIINLDSMPSTPAMDLTGQATSQNASSLFSALLMQQMNGLSLSGLSETESAPDLGQGLNGNLAAMKMISTLLGQMKDTKSTMPADQLSEKMGDTTVNPMLAMWIASIFAGQQQPDLQNLSSITSNGLPPQLSGSGLGNNALLQTLEKQVPGLMKSLTGGHMIDAKPDVAKPKVDDPDNILEQHSFENALDAIQSIQQEKADPSSSPPRMAPDVAKQDAKPVSEKPAAIDQDALNIAAPTKDAQQSPVVNTPPGQSADAKSQGQESSHPEQNRSGSDNKKSQTSGEQLQTSTQSKEVSSAAASSIDQTSFAAAVQNTGHAASNSSSAAHFITTASTDHVSLREAGNVPAMDATPRIVNAAKLMEAAGEAEMRVSMKTEAAGTVDVRAVLQGDHISATVAAQHSGTRDWLVANLHELQATLSRDDLNLRTFEVTDSSLQNDGQGTQSRQQEQQQNNTAYAQFSREVKASSAGFDDIDVQETAGQALSLLA